MAVGKAGQEAGRDKLAIWVGPEQVSADGMGLDRVVAPCAACYGRFKSALSHYRRDGEPTSELDSMRLALRYLRPLYGNTFAADFGPLALKALRERAVARLESGALLLTRDGKELPVEQSGAPIVGPVSGLASLAPETHRGHDWPRSP